VIQDDALVCRDFRAGLKLVVAGRPDDTIALFTPGVGEHGRRVLDACRDGKRWAHLFEHLFLPTVAVVYPAAGVHAILAYVDSRRIPDSQTADDGVLGHWMRDTQTRVLACVPSLVEHPDTVASLVGTHHMSGLNPARIAACWLGPDLSPLELDWT
jgi:hypothetical protein